MQRMMRYDYDVVSIITDINNSAGILSNELGGPYSNTYQYDNLYRLVYAEGSWLGGQNTGYELEMAYHPNGRISRKTLAAGIVTQTPVTSSFSSVGYDNKYNYTNTGQPNTLTYIDNGPQQDFGWDAKGNLVFHKHDGLPSGRHLCWDEQNRLQGVMDNQSLSVYQYDANGDRTYKLTGKHTHQNISGTWHHFYQLDNATLYASPYLVVTPKGYTKHYYAESERVASQVGKGRFAGVNVSLADSASTVSKLLVATQSVGMDPQTGGTPSTPYLAYLGSLTDRTDSVPENYFYHPDHLGSASWITDSAGRPVQHLQYLPWGESFVDQRSSTFDGARFTFSAKEKDAETGYSVTSLRSVSSSSLSQCQTSLAWLSLIRRFGSRYYSSDLSIWLSVDPQALKYPHQSNYVYCGNNPIVPVFRGGKHINIIFNASTPQSIAPI